jgi:hypothetical protein
VSKERLIDPATGEVAPFEIQVDANDFAEEFPGGDGVRFKRSPRKPFMANGLQRSHAKKA